jgi:hypothetical protein
MVCPLRFVLALASVALLLYSASVLLLDTEAGEALKRRLTRSDRSWTRFLAAFFTGELIYSFYGKGEGAEAAEAAEAAATAATSAAAAAGGAPEAGGGLADNAAAATVAADHSPCAASGSTCEDAAAALLLATEGLTAVLHQRASAVVA